jgi:four helix bundle protein
MKDYKELVVWQKGVQLATEAYRITENFPRVETFGLTSQIRRAAASVPANIAEGWGRGSAREYIQFLTLARDSLLELETHLIVSEKLGFLDKTKSETARALIVDIGKMLTRLMQSLHARSRALHPESRVPSPESR